MDPQSIDQRGLAYHYSVYVYRNPSQLSTDALHNITPTVTSKPSPVK